MTWDDVKAAMPKRGDIKDWASVKANWWEWGWLSDVFPRGISPTDIDALVEINGKFLFIETKAPGKTVETGQRLALERLRDVTGAWLLYIWGPRNDPKHFRLEGPGGYVQDGVAAEGQQTIRQICEWWVSSVCRP